MINCFVLLLIGIDVSDVTFPKDIRDIELLADIRRLNADQTVDGIMLEVCVLFHISVALVCRDVEFTQKIIGKECCAFFPQPATKIER